MQEFQRAYDAEPELPAARDSLAVALTELGTRLKLCGHSQVRQCLRKPSIYVDGAN